MNTANTNDANHANDANNEEWAIPTDGATLPATGSFIRTADTTPTVRFDHDGAQHRLPIVIWAISTDQLTVDRVQGVIRSICHPDKLSVIVPMLDEMIPLGQRIMESYVRDIQDNDYITNPEHAGRTIDRVYGIGDAEYLPVAIAVGVNLMKNQRELAEAASDQIMTTIFRESHARGSAGMRP